MRCEQERPRLGGRAGRAREEAGWPEIPQRPGKGCCGSQSNDAGITLGAPRGPRIPNSPAAAAESGRRRRTPGSAIPCCPGWGETAAAHFLSNPARRPTSLATVSISTTLLVLRSEEPAEGRDPVSRRASQVPSACRHSDPPRDPDSVLWARVPQFLRL